MCNFSVGKWGSFHKVVDEKGCLMSIRNGADQRGLLYKSNLMVYEAYLHFDRGSMCYFNILMGYSLIRMSLVSVVYFL